MISESIAKAKALLEEEFLLSDFNTESEKNQKGKGRGQRTKYKPVRLQQSESEETSQNSDSSSQSLNRIPDPPTEENESMPVIEQEEEKRLENVEVNQNGEQLYHTTKLLQEYNLSYTTDPLGEEMSDSLEREQLQDVTDPLDEELLGQTTKQLEKAALKRCNASVFLSEEKEKKDHEVGKKISSVVKYQKEINAQRWQEHSKTLLKMIVEHPDSKLFRQQIDEKTYPGYYSRLNFKIDLPYIISNLEI